MMRDRPVLFPVFLAIVVAILLLSDSGPYGHFPPCPLFFLTGLYCPGCGTIRALDHLLHGRAIAALHSNPLLLVALPILAWLCFHKRLRTHPRTPVIALIVLLVFGLLRNLPFFPLSLLAPH